jgi:integrase/recombinase XerD
MENLEGFARYITAIRTKTTSRKYLAAIRRFLDWLKDRGVADLRKAPRDVLGEYVSELVEDGLLPSTIHLQVAGINRYLKWCAEHDVELPAFYPPELPSRIKTEVKDVLTPDLFGQYFTLADELREPVRTAVMLLPCTGLRAQEMVTLPLVGSLRRTPLQLKGDTQKEALTLVVKGKGGHERFVPLLDEGVQVVSEFVKGWRRDHPDTKWFFPGRRYKAASRHLSDRTLRGAIHHIWRPLGKKFTPHTLRRTYLTFLYHQGVDPVTLAKIAGHRDVKTLMNFYLYLDEVDIGAAVHNAGSQLMGERSHGQTR